ncbi:hypothetical protein ACOMHN_023823 [Nucella lapillus]
MPILPQITTPGLSCHRSTPLQASCLATDDPDTCRQKTEVKVTPSVDGGLQTVCSVFYLATVVPQLSEMTKLTGGFPED